MKPQLVMRERAWNVFAIAALVGFLVAGFMMGIHGRTGSMRAPVTVTR